MIKNSQRTIYAASLQLAQMVGEEYTILPNTTLNEKFELNSTELLPSGTYPTLQYITIGVGGNSIIEDANAYSYNSHTAIDAALYEHIPFIMREPANDLDMTERMKYRFRVSKLVNGTEYICYYLKRIDNIEDKKRIYKVQTNNNNSLLSLFNTNTDKLLNPVPVDKATKVTNFLESNYVAKIVKIDFILDAVDLQEINNVLNILYPDTKKSITEIGLCTGYDKDFGNYKEAIATQIAYFTTVDIDTSLYINSNKTVNRTIDIGSMEPLIT